MLIAIMQFAVQAGVHFFLVCGRNQSEYWITLHPLQNELGERVTLPYLFKQNGYYTMSLGKVFHGNDEHNDLKAWDEIYGYGPTELGKKGESRNMTDGVLKWCWWQAAEGSDEDQPDGRIAKKAVEFLKTEKDKPFFLAVGFHKPHDPFIAPKKYFDLYPLENCNPPELPVGWEPPYKHSLPNQTEVFNKFSEQDKREFLRSYYACTSFMDTQVGKIMEALKESGELENTLIIFFGDHGYHLGEHNWWNKVTIYEKGTNAPFIIAGTGINVKGIESNAMFEFIDIYPTIAELAGLENIPAHLEGKSFATVVNDPNAVFRSEVRAIINRGPMMGRMVKNEDFRYIEWDNGNQGTELYDQNNDPIEYNNLADNPDYSDIKAEMKKLIDGNGRRPRRNTTTHGRGLLLSLAWWR
jgi:iduronate 2-sulfatase